MSQLTFPIRRFMRIVAATVALCAFGLAGAPAHAQTAQPQQPAAGAPAQPAQIPVVVGVLDTQAILNTSSAGKSLNTQWMAALKALNDDMEKKEGQLRTQAQQLETQRSANPPLSPADYATKRKALEQQGLTFQKAYTKGKDALDQRLDKARNAIAASARKAMQDVAQARRLTLVLDRAAVPYSPQPWNITDEVLARLNKALPSVKF